MITRIQALRLLFTFAILTTLGYLLYELFLRSTHPLIISLFCFFGPLILFFFDRANRACFSLVYWNKHAIVLVILLSIFDLVYWYTFWYGLKGNASAFVVGLLSLSIIVSPIAVHLFCKSDSLHSGVRRFLAVSAFLLAGVVLMKVNLPASELLTLENWIPQLSWEDVRPTILILMTVIAHAGQEVIKTKIGEARSSGRIETSIRVISNDEEIEDRKFGDTQFQFLSTLIGLVVTIFIIIFLFKTNIFVLIESIIFSEWIALTFLAFGPIFYLLVIINRARIDRELSAHSIPPMFAIRPILYTMLAWGVMTFIHPTFQLRCQTTEQSCIIENSYSIWIINWNVLPPLQDSFFFGATLSTIAFLVMMRPLWKNGFLSETALTVRDRE